MKITEVKVEHETFKDGRPGLVCRLTTDESQDIQQACCSVWDGPQPPARVAATLRQFADAIEKMAA